MKPHYGRYLPDARELGLVWLETESVLREESFLNVLIALVYDTIKATI